MGFAGYLLHLVGWGDQWHVPVAVGATVLLTVLVLSGLKRSNYLNILIVTVTLGSLGAFVLLGVPDLFREGAQNLSFSTGSGGDGLGGFFYATALMFVAYAGYARVATMGEEVKDPKRNIPRAIIILLIVTAILYVAVAVVAIGAAGVEALLEETARSGTPLEAAARALSTPGVSIVIAIGAVTATFGVLLNLILGLSRVVLAMGTQGDLPPFFAQLSRDATARRRSP